MSDVITLRNGKNFLVRDGSDFSELLEQEISRDAALYFENYAITDPEFERLDDQYEELRNRYIKNLEEIRRLAHEAMGLITHTKKEMVTGKEIDLVKMSNTLGNIGVITMKELGRMK